MLRKDNLLGAAVIGGAGGLGPRRRVGREAQVVRHQGADGLLRREHPAGHAAHEDGGDLLDAG
ncbi:MAG: hypothetical protein ACO3ZY_08385, partial [Phycisphaerales bacterium]